METPAGYGVVLVTAGNMQEVRQRGLGGFPHKRLRTRRAEAIANALVEAKLAACVSLLPIHSIYTWQGELHKEQEWQLLIKTDLAQFPALEAKIKELHSYEVSEIIALPIVASSQAYLQWIYQQVKSKGEE